jgi:hypothetical protein
MQSARFRYSTKTSQAQSAPGDIDHLKISGGKGISRQKSAADTVGKHYAVRQG